MVRILFTSKGIHCINHHPILILFAVANIVDEEHPSHKLLRTLHQFQQEGDLCDVTVVSSDGEAFEAHAGVLAAASSVLKRQLEQCQRGNYQILTSFSGHEIITFILYAYTGERTDPLLSGMTGMGLLCEKYDNVSHAEMMLSMLSEFAIRGLFCNMSYHNTQGSIQPAHSYLLAAKCPIVLQHVTSETMLYMDVGTSMDNYSVDLSKVIMPFLYCVNFATSNKLVNTQSLGVYTCQICEKTFKFKSKLVAHQRTHTNHKPCACDKCGKKFKYMCHLKRHEMIHSKETHCKICDEVFSCEIVLKEHLVSHANERPYVCVTCGKDFKTKSNLMCHEKSHSDNKPHPCDVCNKSFKMRCHLTEHQLTHLNPRPHKCDTCGKTFVYKSSLNTHKHIHSGQTFCCDKCGKIFRFKSNLSQHQVTHAVKNKDLVCQYCDKSFNNLSDLEAHKPIHKPVLSHVCDICDEAFTQISHLKDHEMRHTENRPHMCTVCEKGFPLKSQLRAHKLIHTSDRSYICQVCDKGFPQKSYLNRHQLTHSEINDKSYSCDTCLKSFSRLLYLRRHQQTHTKEKRYLCEVCDKVFHQKSYLHRHKMTHTSDKRYVCDICQERFSQKAYLNRHKMSHQNPVKPHSCETCGKCFLRKGDLKVHAVIHSGAKPYVCNVCGNGFVSRRDMNRHQMGSRCR